MQLHTLGSSGLCMGFKPIVGNPSPRLDSGTRLTPTRRLSYVNPDLACRAFPSQTPPTVRIHSLSIGGDPKIGRMLSLHPATSPSKRSHSSVFTHLPQRRASHLASWTALVAPSRLRPRRNCLVAHRRRSSGSIGPANERPAAKRGCGIPPLFPGMQTPLCSMVRSEAHGHERRRTFVSMQKT